MSKYSVHQQPLETLVGLIKLGEIKNYYEQL